MYPTRDEAERLLKEAEAMNPGPWGNHSRVVARCAERIAVACGNMDPDKAYVLGLLHDYGRRHGVAYLKHVWDGWQDMLALGFDEVARVCLTHSFNTSDLEEYIGMFDITPAQVQQIREALAGIQMDDYDRVVQLCDSISNADGPAALEARMSDVKRRYGRYPQNKWDKNFELKRYFEEKMGADLYAVVSEKPVSRARANGETKPVKRVEVFGKNYSGFWRGERTACRGIVLRGGEVLLSYETQTGQYMIPGGGLEPEEGTAACCAREVAEETGIEVKPGDEALEIDEYYEDWKYITHYFLCEPAGTVERRLTEREREAGMEPRWVPIRQAIDEFSRHAEFVDTDEMRRGLYFREYTALQSLLGKPALDARVRLMVADDYDRVYELWMSSKNMGFNDQDDSREGIEKFLRRNPNTCFVALDGDALIGVILCGHDGRRGTIHHMAVAEACQHKGVGKALVERALDALKAEGIHKVALVAFKRNGPGNTFWEKLGFTVRDDLNYRNRELTRLTRIDT